MLKYVRIRTASWATVLLLFMVVGPISAAPVGVNPKDTDFIKKAAQSSLAEVRLTDLAQERAQSAEVKQFAASLHDDHMAAREKLHAVAHDAHVVFPAELTKEQNTTYQRLAKLEPNQFDATFVAETVKNHEKVVSLYQKESGAGKSPAVKQYVEDTLPLLQRHLEAAKVLQLKVQQGGKSS